MNYNVLFRIPTIRENYSRFRFICFRRFGKLRSFSNLANVNKSSYSKKAFKQFVSIGGRITFLVAAVESSARPKKTDKLLSLGPRFESELFGYRAIGYQPKNIFALDNFAYSKLVTLGNMHKMDYPDSSFNIVVGGWIIAYSNKPISAMKEIYRVTQPKGLAIISWDIPENIDDSFDCVDKIFLPMVNGNQISFNRLVQNWKIHSLFIGNTAWSSERRTLLVVLRK